MGREREICRDGAYDAFDFREVLGEKIEQIIPPPENAVVRKGKKDNPLPGYLKQRNEAVEYIDRHGSTQWKAKHGYHKRSLNETVMYGFKTIFGGKPDAWLMESQPVSQVEMPNLKPLYRDSHARFL